MLLDVFNSAQQEEPEAAEPEEAEEDEPEYVAEVAEYENEPDYEAEPEYESESEESEEGATFAEERTVNIDVKESITDDRQSLEREMLMDFVPEREGETEEVENVQRNRPRPQQQQHDQQHQQHHQQHEQQPQQRQQQQGQYETHVERELADFQVQFIRQTIKFFVSNSRYGQVRQKRYRDSYSVCKTICIYLISVIMAEVIKLKSNSTKKLVG